MHVGSIATPKKDYLEIITSDIETNALQQHADGHGESVGHDAEQLAADVVGGEPSDGLVEALVVDQDRGEDLAGLQGLAAEAAPHDGAHHEEVAHRQQALH